jgi:hypothetical protein
MGDACKFQLAALGFLILGLPSLLAILTAWVLVLILALRLHQWAWLASLVLPIVVAAVLLAVGSPLAANGNDPTGSQLGNTLLAIGWLVILLALLVSLVYSLWPQRRPSIRGG